MLIFFTPNFTVNWRTGNLNLGPNFISSPKIIFISFVIIIECHSLGASCSLTRACPFFFSSLKFLLLDYQAVLACV